MIIFGIMLIVAGAALIIYGTSLNNSMEAQLEALFNSGATNPGTIWIIIGAVVVVVGLVLLIVGVLKRNNTTAYTTPHKPECSPKSNWVCPRCNAPIDDGTSFCPFCGIEIGGAKPIPPKPDTTPLSKPIPDFRNPNPTSSKPELGFNKPDDSDLD